MASKLGIQPPRFYANIAPGPDFDQNTPDQFTGAYLEKWITKLGGNKEVMGLSFAFSLLNGPLPAIVDANDSLRLAAEKTGIHVIPAFDLQNWWDYRSDLWNWFAPERPGYSPSNRENVEWTGPGPEHATRIAWRNWGSQIRVAPPPNLRAKAFRTAGSIALTSVLKPWAKWLDSKPYGPDVLTPGIKLGWEASLGINAFIYGAGTFDVDASPSTDPKVGLQPAKGLFGGMSPLGWAALSAASKPLPEQLTKTHVEWIVRDYLQWMVDTARRCGISEAQLATHAGGQFAPYALHISHDVARVRGATPGWSLYNIRPEDAGDLIDTVKRTKHAHWCCAEWMSFATSAERWADDLEATLRPQHCRYVVAYNAQDLVANPVAKAGLANALRRDLTRG
ncbi:MAG: hypothetical protein ACKO14_05215 [Armatimonadota bacterium]